MKHPLLAATLFIALTQVTLTGAAFAQTASGSASGQNGAQYGDPNNAMAEGSQTTNGALSGASPGAVTDGSSETHSYSGADLDKTTNGALGLQSDGALNGGSNLSSNP